MADTTRLGGTFWMPNMFVGAAMFLVECSARLPGPVQRIFAAILAFAIVLWALRNGSAPGPRTSGRLVGTTI